MDARAPVLGAGGIPRPAEVRAAAGMHNLPRPPAALFVGREDALTRLEAGLAGEGSVVLTQAVVGLGGVGKSELALQYAHARRNDYQLTWWIAAEEPAQVEAGLAGLAGRLCPELAVTVTTAEAAAWAITWLQAHPGWLLILDDVTVPVDVGQLLGQLHGGHVLLTTRRDTGWQRVAAPVRLGVLDPGPAAALVIAATGQVGPREAQAAGEIAAELGCLPLALDQAVAYITQNQIPLGRYLDLLRAHPARMYAAGAAEGQAQPTVARVWDITLAAIGREDARAAGLLRVLACYAPDSIPRSLIGGPDPGPEVDEALGLLASYSMITLTPEAVSMHKLVQAVVLAAPGDPGEAPPRDTAVAWLGGILPPNPRSNVAAWPFLRALIPHAEAVASRYPARGETAALGRTLNQVALFYQSQGAYRDALRLRSVSLDIAQRIYGDDHLNTAIALGNLARTHCAQGRHAEALPLEGKALAITKAALGLNHPDTAVCLGNLARTYSALGRHAKALPLEQRALTITENILGPNHPDTAVRLNNLALTLGALARHAEALPLEQRALTITENVLGSDHPRTAVCLANLAFTLGALGRHAEALPLKERALTITKDALGPDHPDTAVCLANLAFTYGALGRHAEALPLQEKALAVAEAALGSYHPDTAVHLGNLAATYRAVGREVDAEALDQRAHRDLLRAAAEISSQHG